MDTILSYCRYNLMNTDMDQRLTPFARDNCIGLINASGLQMGLLTERGAPDWHPAPAEIRNAAKRIVQICKRHGANVSEVALASASIIPMFQRPWWECRRRPK